ncbi:hypothetical protein Q3G72_018527 [Acer saccharum]|nr:hypothetical protein Q3G72_007252 [Acer saccharum]KAK1571519.1 hypothetical protein Q3G72_018527 [Acer saccharum]
MNRWNAIYGWPISSRVAQYGWNSRRRASSRVVERKKAEGASKEGQHMGFEGLKRLNRGDPSFAKPGFRLFPCGLVGGYFSFAASSGLKLLLGV